MPLKRLDDRPFGIAPDEVICVTRLRNEFLRLPWCLDYHRRLGVDRFIIVDNASTDGSTEYLRSREDVHLFWTDESYVESRQGMEWINPLLREYACGHWTLFVDVDELLVYPLCERAGLKQLGRFLEHGNADALEAVMIDMYGRRAIGETVYRRGENFLDTTPYFDNEPLVKSRGGVRKRLFWADGDETDPPPFLRKVPFVKWRENLRNDLSAHVIKGVKPSRTLSGGLLHFKFFSDLLEKVPEAVESKQYWNGSAQYARYQAGLNRSPGLTPFYEKSVRYRDSLQLAELGFVRGPGAFASYLEHDAGG